MMELITILLLIILIFLVVYFGLFSHKIAADDFRNEVNSFLPQLIFFSEEKELLKNKINLYRDKEKFELRKKNILSAFYSLLCTLSKDSQLTSLNSELIPLISDIINKKLNNEYIEPIIKLSFIASISRADKNLLIDFLNSYIDSSNIEQIIPFTANLLENISIPESISLITKHN